MRIIFVGLHNKQYIAPLDSGTKTGKLIDRIIKKLPDNIEIIKSNILNTDRLVSEGEIFKYVNEWQWTYLPVDDDVVVLLGAMTYNIYKNNVKKVGHIIRVAHPSSIWSHISMDKYVDKVYKLIKKYLDINKIKNESCRMK